ncbi:MAG: TrmH family RNA methyltransferase [Victivallaceae bacterium]|nr:TrmH family RNA methyltransferase [Victivallaceae bacterium]
MVNDWRICLVLDRMRSAFNVGNILRIADAVGACEVVGCGYTPLPPHPKLAKTAMGAENMVPCRHADNSLEAVRMLRSEGYAQIVAVDCVEGRSRFVWDFEFKFPLALVFGNEALGILPETIDACDAVAALPMFGNKSSINVGNAAAATLYAVVARANPDILQKWRLENEN